MDEKYKWLHYWRYLGPYNNEIPSKIDEAANTFRPLLAEVLSQHVDLTREKASEATSRYLNNFFATIIDANFSSYERPINKYTNHGMPGLTNDHFSGYQFWSDPWGVSANK